MDQVEVRNDGQRCAEIERTAERDMHPKVALERTVALHIICSFKTKHNAESNIGNSTEPAVFTLENVSHHVYFIFDLPFLTW
jgi:hypothetical protein